jgi:hypothetical protein
VKFWLLLFVAAHNLLACTIAVVSVARARKHAEVVFGGTIVKITGAEIVFKVHRVWKGRVPAEFAMAKVTAYDSCFPGFQREYIQVGAELLVYGRRMPNLKVDGYVAGEGPHTKPVEASAEDLRKLGAGHVPLSRRVAQ